MKRKKLNFIIKYSVLFIATATVSANLAKGQVKAKRAEFVLRSNASTVIIGSDTKSPTVLGKPIQGKIGENTLLLSAPGFIPRSLRFWLKAGMPRDIEVNFAPSTQVASLTALSKDRKISPKLIQNLPSICMRYVRNESHSAHCSRKTLQDDSTFSEPIPLLPGDMRALLKKPQDLAKFRDLLNSSTLASQDQRNDVEELLARYPDNSSIFLLASKLAFQAGDCPRVQDLFSEAAMALKDIQPLLLNKALCYELQDQNTEAIKTLSQALSRTQGAAPYIYFHLGRLNLKGDIKRTAQYAETCLEQNKYDMACQELRDMTVEMKNSKLPKTRLNLEEVTFKTFRLIEEAQNKESYFDLYFKVLALLQAHPHSLEFWIFMAWLDSIQGIGGGLGYYDSKIQNSGLFAGNILESLINSLEKRGLTRLLSSVYQRRIELEPKDPNLWIRLIRSFATAGQCQAALDTIEKGQEILPKYNTQLLDVQAECLMNLKRPQDALLVYKKLTTAQPNVWTTYFNIGKTYQVLGNFDKARQNFEKAIGLQPPPAGRGEILSRLEKLKPTVKQP